MRNFLTVFTLFLLAGVCSAEHDLPNKPTYDESCNIFSEAMRMHPAIKEQQTYIKENIDERISSKDLNDAYELIYMVDPADRYSVFKNAVEANINEPWECPALKTYFSQFVGVDSQ